MVSETATSYLDVMLCTLYISMKAGYLLHYGSSSFTYNTTALHGKMKDQNDTLDEWKHELASHGRKGASSVEDWVDGWFKLLDPDSRRSRSEDVKRGNVETYLSERVFGLDLKKVLDDPTKHHALIILVSELERKRNRRFPSGYNTDLRLSDSKEQGGEPYRPLFFRFIAILFSLIQEIFERSQTVSVARSFGSSRASKPSDGSPTIAPGTCHSKPDVHTPIRTVPQSSMLMTSSLSNLSSIGLCVAPPLRTRQRSRTIEAVISGARIPVSSLAMMSSMSNLSSIGMCAAPPLRTRQRSRSSVVGYASAVPFASRQRSVAA